MGNLSTKDGSHGSTGPNADSFHTPPASPQGEGPSIPYSSLPSSTSPVFSSVPSLFHTPSEKKTQSATISSTTSSFQPPPERRPHSPIHFNNSTNSTHRKSGSTASIKGQLTLGRNGGLQTSTPRTLFSQGNSGDLSPTKSLSSVCAVSPVEGSSPEKTWKEKDSGVGHTPLHGQAAEDKHDDDLQMLLDECKTTLGVTPNPDGTMNTTEALQHLLTEVKTLKCTLQTERGEWVQFQADLQVAVAVADRLRAEAEEELAALRKAHQDMERELAAAQQRQKEADMQLVTLRGELKESRQRQAVITQTPGNNDTSHKSDKTSADLANNADNKEETQRGRDRVLQRVACQRRNTESHNEVVRNDEEPRPIVSKRYLRNVTNEEQIGEEVRSNETRRTVTITERSRSLSRLPAFSDLSTTQNRNSQSHTISTSASTNKNLVQLRGRRSLEWQDGKSTDKGKREESLNKYNSALTDQPPTKSQDGFNLLLRRHGGSKRNSLLRWCQNRTQGYKNIDITNFSSSWSDGLAFCAIYHTYLPSHIPYSSLCQENKRDNLSLAFKTGESVGIEQSLTVEEMLRVGGPDWQSVLTYVESVYRHFEM